MAASNALIPSRVEITKRAAALSRPLGEQVAAALQASARSAHSARSYRYAIALFLRYVGGALGVELVSASHEGRRVVWGFAGDASVLRRIEPGHVDGFRAWREAEGDGVSTLSLRMAAVASFLAVACRDGILARAQAANLGVKPYKAKQKSSRRPTGRRLEKSEVRALQAAPDLGTVKGKRDRAILDTMLYAGLRVEEVCRLDLADLRLDKGRWWLVFEGKGQRPRKIKIHDDLYRSLSGWLGLRHEVMGQSRGPVFVSVNKAGAISARALNAATVNRLVAELGAKAGLAPADGCNRLSPHDLRRTCARNAYENGAPLPLIQAMLGHASVETTMIYIGANDAENGGAVDFVRY